MEAQGTDDSALYSAAEAAGRSRNFRKNYYRLVGVQTVEVKVSLESAFAGDVLDLERLTKLCLWVRIPHLYRPLVWKVLLGVLPTSKDVWSYVEDQRSQQFQDLKRAAQFIYPPTHRNKKSLKDYDNVDLTADLMVRMLLIQLNRLTPHRVVQYPSPKFQNLTAIASCFLDICDSVTEADAFWLFKFFVRRELSMVEFLDGSEENAMHQKTRITDSVTHLWKLLQEQDADLVERLEDLDVDLEVCCERWFANYFAEILPPESLERIWDILFGGRPAILNYVALCLILAVQRQIQAARGPRDVQTLFGNIGSQVNHNAVVSSAIDLWEKPLIASMGDDARKALGY
ncbi:hypothetical protein SmJEL517_g03661 [Synchytrium microbalum]|uniref:TBC1 domain family member 7 n=1 Tax=Synchytrium microbalum TaxID=1806994 RepID=A0A507C2C5_9FUNG|nr:uncharacterized protein SmJEL517_g03661 [Synchytrium microbalum]TPX33508.1 hypothetical protein SmJEL517_g03661 [Synchytrium microbalum]